jgi:hypothetical protein
MQRRPLTFAVAFALVAGTVIVAGVGAAGRPTCLVSNERTHLGSTSLQAGIDAASAGDTLVVKGTCVGSPPSGDTDRAASNVRKSLTIRGISNKSFGPATLDGGGVARVLFVDFWDPERQGFSLTLENLTITHGYGYDGSGGGGLLVQGGTVALTDVTVVDNAGMAGGGIEIDLGAMTITNSTVSGNTGAMGGGILNSRTLTLTDSVVSTNSGHWGGGILNVSTSATATIVRSVFRGNTADYGGGGIGNDYGGSITLTDSSVTDNTVDQLGGGVFNGHKDYMTGRPTTMTIETSTVSGNASGSSGGGIENRGAMTLVGSIVSGNSGVNCGGGVSSYLGTLDIVDSSVTGNTAVCAGGIANSSAAMTITNSTVSDNSATINGGGLLNAASMLDTPTTMTISGSVLRGNTATNGGGIINFGSLMFAGPPTAVGGNTATTGGGVLHLGTTPVTGLVTGGCPVSLGGNVLYSPTNTPTNYSGFACPMPVPVLAENGTENYTDAFGSPYTRYKMTITNWVDYAPELFTPAPDLAPCGSNTNASRTWVTIYRAADSSQIYGFCAFASPSGLTQLWFGLPLGTTPPSGVFVTLTDRRTGQIVTSSTVSFAP